MEFAVQYSAAQKNSLERKKDLLEKKCILFYVSAIFLAVQYSVQFFYLLIDRMRGINRQIKEKKCILLYVSRLPMLVHRVVRKSLLVEKLITPLCQILFALGIPYFYLSYNGDLIIVSVLHLMLMLHLLLVFFFFLS